MGRLSRLKRIALVAAVVGMAAGLFLLVRPGGELTSDPDLPNSIPITADDLGWKEFRCCGGRDISMPNIDRLAREGVR